jgi:hypothetical protein
MRKYRDELTLLFVVFFALLLFLYTLLGHTSLSPASGR